MVRKSMQLLGNLWLLLFELQTSGPFAKPDLIIMSEAYFVALVFVLIV
jgi:hypothetical protein